MEHREGTQGYDRDDKVANLTKIESQFFHICSLGTKTLCFKKFRLEVEQITMNGYDRSYTPGAEVLLSNHHGSVYCRQAQLKAQDG